MKREKKLSYHFSRRESRVRSALSVAVRCVALFGLCLLPLPVQGWSENAGVYVYRQSAYISNAYFSDQIAKDGDLIEPLTVVKALQSQSSPVVGYFILDLILTQAGHHEFKVNVLNKAGRKVTDLTYPQVEAINDGSYPLYRAVGSISDALYSGLWFFKVYDRVNGGTWHRLGTFAVTILVAEEKHP